MPVANQAGRLDEPSKRLAARLASQILLLLDQTAPSWWDMFDYDSTRLQNRLEELIVAEAIRFLKE